MTAAKHTERKEIGDVAMGLGADAGSAGIVRTKHVTFDQPGQELALEGGGTLAPFTVAYETYGKLSERKDNAILVTHALSGDAHVAGLHSANDRRPGWWDMMIGPGKGLDTDKYFVISSNVIGGCSGSTGPASMNPATGRPYGTDFPIITIADMVNAQAMLLDHLGIEKLLAAVGGSMGGMQVLEWAVSHPERVHLCVPLATAARQPTQAIAFNEVGRQAIMADLVEGDRLCGLAGSSGERHAEVDALGMRDGPLQHLHASHRTPHGGEQLLDAEVVEEHRLGVDHVGDRDDGEVGAERPARGGVHRGRPGRAAAAADHVGADDEVLVGVEPLAGPDHHVPPAGAPVVGAVTPRHVRIAREGVGHEDGVVLALAELAIRLVGDGE